MNPVNYQLFLTIPRILEIIIYFGLFIFLNRRFRGKLLSERPLLHNLMLMGFFCCFIWSLVDVFVYPLAPLSFDPAVNIYRSGYDLEYPSLLFANILKDIVMTAVLMQIWCFFFAGFAIEYGEKRTLQMIHDKKQLFIVFGLIIFIVFIEKVEIQITDGVILVGTIGDTIFSIGKYLISMVLYLIVAWRLRNVFHRLTKENYDPQFASRVRNFMIGIFLVGFSFVWYLSFRVFSIVFSLTADLVLYLLVSFVLHLFWIISPFYLYKSLKVEDDTATIQTDGKEG